jgi:hypothetical protein
LSQWRSLAESNRSLHRERIRNGACPGESIDKQLTT